MSKPKNTETDFYQKLEKKDFSPVYFIFGAEEFLIQQYTDDLLRAALADQDRDFNLDIFYANECDAATVVNAASSFPMMAERRVVLVRDLHQMPEAGLKLLLSYAAKPSPTTCLVLSSAKMDAASGFVKKLPETVYALECRPLYENQIPQWLTLYVKKRGYSITPEAVSLLQAEIGASLLRLASEIEKIELLLEGRKVIEAADVEKVVGSSRQFTVFELRDALGERNAPKAVRTLNRLLEVGEKPVGIVASLFTHFASLAKAKELDRQSPKEMLAAALKVNPYFVDKIFYQANRYSTEQLDQVFSLLLEADQQLKSSAQKPELILQLLVMEIVTLGRKNEQDG